MDAKPKNPCRCLTLFVGAIAVLLSLSMTEAKPDEPTKSEKPAAESMLGKEAGQVRDDNGLKMKLVWCPPGFFTMEQVEDNPNERNVTPVKVFLTRGYWLGKYEVTQAEWKQVMTTEPWKGAYLTKERAGIPATSVSWYDAVDFCRLLTEQERKTGRLSDSWEYTLPTEAQWERACRAHTETEYSFGDDAAKLGEYAWFDENALNVGEGFARRVGQKKPNRWGLHDMHGNVAEWCRDYYADKVPGGRDPEMTEKDKWYPDSFHAVRGGGRGDDSDSCRSGCRNGNTSDERNAAIGFRVMLEKSSRLRRKGAVNGPFPGRDSVGDVSIRRIYARAVTTLSRISSPTPRSTQIGQKSGLAKTYLSVRPFFCPPRDWPKS